MKITKFLNIDIEPAPPELELEIEMQCREIMKSNDLDNVKRLVVDLLKSIAKQTTNTLDDKAVAILEKQLFP